VLDLLNSLFPCLLFEQDVVEKLVGAMMLPNGDPSLKLIEEIKSEMRDMQTKSGSTENMPQELKDLVIENDHLAQTQALIALNEASLPLKFNQFIPLVNQIVVYSGVVLPGVRAKKEHKLNRELTESLLIETVASAAGTNTTVVSDLEKSLPTSKDMLAAMLAIGTVMGGSSGFNPIQIVSNVVGPDNLTDIIQEIMTFPLRFPDFTEKQFVVAEEVALSVGLGFMDQEQAIQRFEHALEPQQHDMLVSMQKVTLETMKEEKKYDNWVQFQNYFFENILACHRMCLRSCLVLLPLLMASLPKHSLKRSKVR
jgi:hypothetical protein